MHTGAEMEVIYANSKLAKLCNSESKLRGEYGPRMAAMIQQRLFELADATVLEDMRHVVGAKCHELGQNLAGLLAVTLINKERLAFRVGDEQVPTKKDGGLDWTQVRCVEIVGIGDYHGR